MSEKKRTVIILAIVIVSTITLIHGFYCVQAYGNRKHAYYTGNLLIEQIEMQLERSAAQKEALTESSKTDLITRAKAVAYILDHVPSIGAEEDELRKMAGIVNVDEIYLFDAGGTIYSGTDMKYIGVNMDSGEQIAFFKPMLNDRDLTMCQDAIPNTTEGRMMMYAMCWSETIDRLIQVGIEPSKLLDEYKRNEVSTIVEGMIVSEGMNILVADAETEEILGASSAGYINKTLGSLGISTKDAGTEQATHCSTMVDGRKTYVSLKRSGEYFIGLTQSYVTVNENIRSGMIMMTVYIVSAIIVLYIVIRTLNRKLINEKVNANSDQMTGLLNRRAYEKYMDELAGASDKDIIYVSMDLNGLKTMNDSRGHDAGDKLIKGAASCMKKTFDVHKTPLYRIGGDEFCAIVLSDFYKIDECKIDFKREIKKWSEENGLELSISFGYARRSEHSELSIYDLAKLADEYMYEEKEAYYSVAGRNRRRRGEKKKIQKENPEE